MAASSTPFPIHAPSILVGSPSFAIRICSGMGLPVVSAGFICLVLITFALYSGVPTGMTSVLRSLKRALDAVHQFVRTFQSSFQLSVSLKKADVSSANRAVMSRSAAPGMLNPFRLDARSMQASGSMARLNSRHDSGAPCLTPRITRYEVLHSPLIMTTVVACLYRAWMRCIISLGRPGKICY